MRITILSTNLIISESELISATLRFDLIPVPVSLEFSVKKTQELTSALSENVEIMVGDMVASLTIIKVVPIETQLVKDGARVGAISCVAILTGCKKLIEPKNVAVVLDETSFNSALKACGMNSRIGADLPLSQFIALKGTLPSARIANYLQQEAAVIMYQQDGRVSANKIDILLKQEPKLKIDPSAVTWVNSQAIEKLQKKSYVSVDENGEAVGTETTKNQIITQKAGLTLRELKNLEKVLICRGSILRPMNLQLNAGDVIEISEKKYLILTSAHKFSTGAMGGASVMASKYWIATL